MDSATEQTTARTDAREDGRTEGADYGRTTSSLGGDRFFHRGSGRRETWEGGALADGEIEGTLAPSDEIEGSLLGSCAGEIPAGPRGLGRRWRLGSAASGEWIQHRDFPPVGGGKELWRSEMGRWLEGCRREEGEEKQIEPVRWQFGCSM